MSAAALGAERCHGATRTAGPPRSFAENRLYWQGGGWRCTGTLCALILSRASPNMLAGRPIGHPVLRNGHTVIRLWPSSWKPCGNSFQAIFFTACLLERGITTYFWNSYKITLLGFPSQFYYLWILCSKRHVLTSRYVLERKLTAFFDFVLRPQIVTTRGRHCISHCLVSKS